MKPCLAPLALAGVLFATALTTAPSAQVGKPVTIVDANSAPEKELLGMPHMNAAIVKGLLDKRPFTSITDLNAYLLGQGLTAEQAMEFYGRAFVHINLNTATPEEILLVPGGSGVKEDRHSG